MSFAPPRDDAGRRDWLRLIRSEGVGPRGFQRLAERFASPAEALAALPEIAPRVRLASAQEAERELEAGAGAGARLVCFGEAAYPPALADIPDPPPVFWTLGEPGLALRPCVAIVGARNASAAGARFAAELARGLGEAGWVVVSGLARGVDAAAHGAALATGTVAVHAGGVDVVYPPQHAALAERIAGTGLRMSERPMGEQPTERSFPRRNRIVSGLSRGVVLVEAAERSGSLITARMAAEQGREVMATPGAPSDPRAAGCNALIRDGAALIRGAADVLEALGPALAPPRAARPLRPASSPSRPSAAGLPDAPPDGPPAARVAALLSAAPVSFDALAAAAGLQAADLAAALSELELDGLIDRRPGDLIALA
ncbi:DNA-processing protein DprA [Rubrimonas cliftonensis]|uniref:DNA processing protein n=1 Tax=Rubrimonas cliftonensis TaxID=89524 RepID=A0A1H3X7K5_9RHOB|nr:DNA-processing protein DprA [Rubrimonas cliftonensis]SDZ95395.1 DNA processing protein [Rubrimonas cliftonensis]